jgi:Phosphopantetheine attachment site/AMP-binding enzyme C-terminal domain
VVLAPLPGAGACLVAFYTSADGIEPGELRGALARVLPPSAIPARLHRLDALPLTENGKVDKRLLASTARAYATGRPAASRVPPSTPTERRIAAAWAQALNRPVAQIGVEDDFFDIGGGSLSALRVVARLGGLITLHDLLGNPVLGALAATAEAAAR